MGEAMSFLRRQFVIGRYYAPIVWGGTLLVTTVMNVALWGGIAACALWTYQGSSAALLPAVVVTALIGSNWLRSWLRQDIGSQRFPHLRQELAARAPVRHCRRSVGRSGELAGDGGRSVRHARYLARPALPYFSRRSDSTAESRA